MMKELILRRIRKKKNGEKGLISFVMSVRPCGTTRLPLKDFLLNFYTYTFFETLPRKFKFHQN